MTLWIKSNESETRISLLIQIVVQIILLIIADSSSGLFFLSALMMDIKYQYL